MPISPARARRPAASPGSSRDAHNYTAIGGDRRSRHHARQGRRRARLGGHSGGVGMRNGALSQIPSFAPRVGVRRVRIPLAPQFPRSACKNISRPALPFRSAGRSAFVRSLLSSAPLLFDASPSAALPPLRPGTNGGFTAHSLPSRVIEAGEPYAYEVLRRVRSAAKSASGATNRCIKARPHARPWMVRISARCREPRRPAPADFSSPRWLRVRNPRYLFDIDVQAAGSALEEGAGSAGPIAQYLATYRRLKTSSRHV